MRCPTAPTPIKSVGALSYQKSFGAIVQIERVARSDVRDVEAVIVALESVDTARVDIANVTLVVPGAIKTDAGTAAEASLLDKAIDVPPTGAGA